MLRVGVLVSGGGTNLQAIMDAVDSGKITNAEISVFLRKHSKTEKNFIKHFYWNYRKIK